MTIGQSTGTFPNQNRLADPRCNAMAPAHGGQRPVGWVAYMRCSRVAVDHSFLLPRSVFRRVPYWSGQQRDYAEGTALKIDAEIRDILDRALERAKAVLKEHWNALVGLVAALPEHETLERADIERLLAGGSPVDEVPCVEEAVV